MILACRLNSFAQLEIPVYVSSAEDGNQIPNTEVWVATGKSFGPGEVVAFHVSDLEGKLRIAIAPGKYYIRISHAGFEEKVDSFVTGRQAALYYQLRPRIFDLQHAVVTVQYKKQAAEKAVERILVIDEKSLQSRSVVNLREALMQQMNVQIRNDNSTGSAMSMMGISGQNVKILVDGVPVIGRLDGNIDLSQINLNDVERIEVIEGPLSINYGSNALAGVINIITKKTTDKQFGLMADVYTESIGQVNVSTTLSRRFGNTGLRINAGRNFFSGWTPGDSGRWDLWKPKEQYFSRLQLDRKIGQVDVGLKAEAFRELLLNKGRPLSPYFETAFDERFITLRSDVKLNATWAINEEATLEGFIATNTYNRQRLKYYRDLVNLKGQLITHDGGSDTTGFKAFMSRATYSRIPTGHKHSYQLGYDVIVERGDGLRIKNGSQTLSDLALFTTAEFELSPKMSLKPGFRVAYNSAFKAPIVPMISARWKSENYTYRASLSQGFRAPDIKELYIEFIDINHDVVGNAKLKPERSNHLLFSIDGKHLKNQLLFKPTLTAFHNDIQDKITLASYAPNKYSYVNISDFQSTGGNIRLAIISTKIQLNLGYALTGVKTSLNLSSEGYNFYSEWNASATKTLKKVDFNLFVKYNGQQNIYTIDAENAAVTQRFTGAYTIADFQMGTSFLNKKLRCNAGVKNLLNVNNVDNILQSSGAHGSDAGYLAVATGRNYFVKLIFQWP